MRNSAQSVETSVTATDNSPSQDFSYPNDKSTRSNVTSRFKLFIVRTEFVLKVENFKVLVLNESMTNYIYLAKSILRSALRNWLFQVSKDGKTWTTLYTHTDDNSLNEPGYEIFLTGNLLWTVSRFTLVCVSYFRPRAVAPFQQIPSHNSKKKIAKKVDDSAGTLGVNIVKSKTEVITTAHQRNENILKSQWKLEVKTIQLPKMRENMERVTNHRAKLSKSKQKNCGLFSTLNWKIALTSGVGF